MGLRRFKLGFGATEESIPYYRYQFRQGQFVLAPDRANGPLNQLFRLLPAGVLRKLGELLYRHQS